MKGTSGESQPAAHFGGACGKAIGSSAGPGEAAASEEPADRTSNQAPAKSAAVETDRGRKRKKRGCLGCGCLLPILILLAILGGGYYWMIAPDLPPRPWELATEPISTFLSSSLGGKVPFIQPADESLPKLDPQIEKEATAAARQEYEKRAPKPSERDQKEAQLRAQAQATGLPITVVSIMETDAGQPVLVAGVRYASMAGPISTSAGLTEGLNAFQKLIDAKTLSLAGLHDLTVAVEDDQGRVLFGVSAPVSKIEAYRAGSISRQELVRSVGFQGQSRLGIIETFGKGVTK